MRQASPLRPALRRRPVADVDGLGVGVELDLLRFLGPRVGHAPWADNAGGLHVEAPEAEVHQTPQSTHSALLKFPRLNPPGAASAMPCRRRAISATGDPAQSWGPPAVGRASLIGRRCMGCPPRPAGSAARRSRRIPHATVMPTPAAASTTGAELGCLISRTTRSPFVSGARWPGKSRKPWKCRVGAGAGSVLPSGWYRASTSSQSRRPQQPSVTPLPEPHRQLEA